MNILDVFKDILHDGMEITKCKELSNKYKLTLSYNGMSATCELNKLCTPGNEKSLCMQAIDNAISSMYLDNGDLKGRRGGYTVNDGMSKNLIIVDYVGVDLILEKF